MYNCKLVPQMNASRNHRLSQQSNLGILSFAILSAELHTGTTAVHASSKKTEFIQRQSTHSLNQIVHNFLIATGVVWV